MRLSLFLAVMSLTLASEAQAARILPSSPAPLIVSTVPSNGDLNPYGVAFAPKDFPTTGVLQPHDILVSNFNASGNLQGTGTTIVRVDSAGKVSTFFQGLPTLGLSTALVVFPEGFVVVGNFPSSDGTCGHATTGSLMVLDANGNLIETFANAPIVDGPWDMAAVDFGAEQRQAGSPDAEIFVSNALTGSVERLELSFGGPFGVKIAHARAIGTGYAHQCDPVTFVDGPTGLAYDSDTDALFVASTLDNAIYKIHDASARTTAAEKGKLVYADKTHLHGPLHLRLAPNGDLVVANNDAINPDPAHESELTEFTKSGVFVAQYSLDPAAGGAFGFAFQRLNDHQARFAAVDDNVPNLSIWTLPY